MRLGKLMWLSHRRSRLAAIGAIALAVSACTGGSGSDSTASSTPIVATPSVATPVATTPGRSVEASPALETANTLMWRSLPALRQRDHTLLDAMAASGDQSFVPVLIEISYLSQIRDVQTLAGTGNALRHLTGEKYADDAWREWINWLGRHSEITPPSEFAAWKSGLLSAIDPAMGAFLYQNVESRIRIEEIVWGGVRKDGIPDLRYPPNIPAAEATYLEGSDRVFGVSINGEHRAYPLRILNAHEMANDLLGGEPIALAY